MNKRSASLVLALVSLMGLTVSCSNDTGVAKISPPSSALDSGNTGRRSTIGNTGERSRGNTSGQSAIGNTGERSMGNTGGRSAIDIENASILVGHWRKTTPTLEGPEDSHLVLEANGVGTSWEETASSRSSITRGAWDVKGDTIILKVEGNTVALSFTMHEGKLVLPNIPGERGFWYKID